MTGRENGLGSWSAGFNDLIIEEASSKGPAIACCVTGSTGGRASPSSGLPGALRNSGPGRAAGWQPAEKFDAIVCLGAVIRGGTPHFDFVAAESAKGIAKVGLDHNIPIINGILTTDTIDQAIERAGTKAGNRGWNAAQSAIEMADLWGKLQSP